VNLLNFPQRFESLLNSYKFSIGFVLGIYNLNSIWNLNLFPKGKLFLLDLSTTMANFEGLEDQEG
jgi:hypothetical protein